MCHPMIATLMDHHRVPISLVASLLFFSQWPSVVKGQASSESLKQRFLLEAPPQWEAYARRTEELQGTLTLAFRWTRNSYEGDGRFEYKTNGHAVVLKTGGKGGSNGKIATEQEHIFGYNPRYAFSLQRTSADQPWLLVQLVDRAQDPSLGEVGRRINSYLEAATFGIRLYGDPLTEIVRKPEFKMGLCRQIQKNGEKLVEIAFTFSKMDGPRKCHFDGQLVFDPSRYWCWRSGEMRITTDGFSSGTLKLEGIQSVSPGEVPPLSRVWDTNGDWASSTGEWSNRQTNRYEVSLSQPHHLPADHEFTLSAFGLPEPSGTVWKTETPRYVWFLIAAAAFAAIAIGLRYLVRRKPPATPA